MVTRLQSEAEDGEKTTSENRCAHNEVGHSSTSRGSSSAGASSSSTGLRDTSRGLASTASSGGRLGGRTVRRLIEGPVAALGVASLSALELLGSVALAVCANGGVDAGIEPEVAHLGGDGLLVGAHHVGGDGSAVAASALVVEGRGITFVAVAGDLALATADVDTGVLLGVAPRLPLVLGDQVGGNRAAGDDGVVGLGSGKASKSRDGDDDR